MNIGVWGNMSEVQSLEEKIKASIAKNAEWIGVVMSQSTNTLLNVELMETAYDRSVVGNPCTVEFIQDGSLTCALGQITSIELRNPHIERHPIQKILSVRGEANPLTKQHDTRRIEISVSAVYSVDKDGIRPTTMSSVPPTGTRVYLLTQEILDTLMEPHKNEIFYIGKIYNTDILLPMIFKHFGSGNDGRGLGEAYHLGVFGKTGSGKSYLAKMLIIAYARHPEMSIIIIDPQGEFSIEIREEKILYRILREKLKRKVEVYPIVKISLTNPETLKRLLIISGFLDKMGIRTRENQEIAAELIVDFLEHPGKYIKQTILSQYSANIEINIVNAYKREVFDSIISFVRNNINRIYVSEQPQQRVRTILDTRIEELYNEWRKIALLFSAENKSTLDNIIHKLVEEKAVIFVDLSEQSAENIFWNEKVQGLILNDIVNALKDVGNEKFKNNEQLNTLVVIDEAHRFAPREKQEELELEELRMNFVDAVRTTRKYGLGWMFISQTIASLHPELINQMRVYFFGYGLSWGAELRALREILGGGGADNHLELYRSFRDPQSSAILGKKEHPFMVFGPVSPLSVSGAPLFMVALDYENEFLKANRFS